MHFFASKPRATARSAIHKKVKRKPLPRPPPSGPRNTPGVSAKGPRTRALASAPIGIVGATREFPCRRPSPRPQRVLAARWRLQDRRDGGAGGGARAAGAGADRPRRHERRRRSLQGLQEARDQADRRPRGLPGRRSQDDQGAAPLRAQPPDAAGRKRPRLLQPGQAHLGRLPRGLLARQGERRHGAALAALRGRDRPHRLPAVALLPAPGRRARRRRPRPPRRPDPGLRPRPGLLRGAEERDRRAGQGQRGDRPLRPRAGPAAGRHRRRPLPAARGLRQPRGAALRADEVDPGSAEDELRHERVLHQELGGNDRVLRRVAGGGPDLAGDRRALLARDRARQPAAAALPDRGRRGAGGDAAPDRRRGAARPLRRPRPGRGGRADGVRARRDRGDGLLLLLPDRLGLRPLREGERRRRRPGARLGRRLDRLLHPQDHRPRPARRGPDLRALPQPRPQIDAGHRHRLLGPRPRADDPLRRREVRPRIGRPDHHLRQDGAARGDPRRRPRARLRLRDRRPPGEADPGADHGPQPLLRGMPEVRPGTETDLRRRARREEDHRRRPGPRGDHPQQLDPRRRGGDRRPAAAGGRAAAAGRGSQRPGHGRQRQRLGQARAPVQDRHPVLDGPDRGDRAC